MIAVLRRLFAHSTQVADAALAEIDEERQLAAQRERLMSAAAEQTMNDRVDELMRAGAWAAHVDQALTQCQEA